jgi:hypothetical protein
LTLLQEAWSTGSLVLVTDPDSDIIDVRDPLVP